MENRNIKQIVQQSMDIKVCLSNESENKFYNDMESIRIREHDNSKDTKFILFELFLQIGTNPEGVFKFKNKNESLLFLQPKIKNYIKFKSKEGLDNYIKDELSKDDLYCVLDIVNDKSYMKERSLWW